MTLLAPADGTYSLASSDAPLVLTVRNDLPFAVQVLLRPAHPGRRRAATSATSASQTLAPGSADDAAGAHPGAPVRRVRRHRAADHARRRPAGRPGADQVKSTAYGSISLIITIGAAALLGLLFLRRLVRFVLRRRRGAAEDEPAAAEGAAVPLPPTRSPV